MKTGTEYGTGIQNNTSLNQIHIGKDITNAKSVRVTIVDILHHVNATEERVTLNVKSTSVDVNQTITQNYVKVADYVKTNAQKKTNQL